MKFALALAGGSERSLLLSFRLLGFKLASLPGRKERGLLLLDFKPDPLAGIGLEHLDGLRHHANLIALLRIRHSDIEITVGDALHRSGKAQQLARRQMGKPENERQDEREGKRPRQRER